MNRVYTSRRQALGEWMEMERERISELNRCRPTTLAYVFAVDQGCLYHTDVTCLSLSERAGRHQAETTTLSFTFVVWLKALQVAGCGWGARFMASGLNSCWAYLFMRCKEGPVP